MAKKQEQGLGGLFEKTEPEAPGQAVDLSDLDQGNVRATGVGLREGEIRALDAIGAELGALLDSEPVARNALGRIAIRRMIEDIRAGRLTLEDLAALFSKPEKPKPRLKL